MEFSVGVLLLVIDAELEFALLSAEHHGLALHAAHHVERRVGASPQGHLQDVVLDALLEGLTQLVLDLKKAVGRTEPADPLVGPLVVVILHPEPDAGPGRLEVVKLGPAQELAPDRSPEAFHLAQRHRVLGPGADMGDAVLLELLLEARLAAPGGILPPVVGEHLLGHAELSDRPAVDLDDGLGRLAAEDLKACHEARVVVEKGDHVGVATPQPEGEDVALPHLVGRGPFEAPGLGDVALGLLRLGLDELLLVEGAPHRLGAGLHQEQAPHHLGDAPHPPGPVLLLELDDPVPDRPREAATRRAAAARRRRVAKDRGVCSLPEVGLHPPVDRRDGNAELVGRLRTAIALVHAHQHRAEAELRGITVGSLLCLRPALEAPGPTMVSVSCRDLLSVFLHGVSLSVLPLFAFKDRSRSGG